MEINNNLLNDESKIDYNKQKYFNYKEQFKRLKKAIDFKFFLEAIFIEYAIIEDRLESLLRHGNKWLEKYNDKHISISEKIKKVQEMVRRENKIAVKYISFELLENISNWKARRNKLVHALLKNQVTTEELENIVYDGNIYAREICNKATSFRRAIERQNTNEIEKK